MRSKSIAASTKLRVAANQRISCLTMFALMSLCSGCDNKETAPVAPAPVFTTVVFDGYKTPGRIEQAKEMGFKDCKDHGPTEFICKHVGVPSLLGVKADSARLTLEYRNRFKPSLSQELLDEGDRTADNLTYMPILFEFPSTEYDDRCIKKMDKDPQSKPIECRKNNAGMDYLKHILTEAGWFKWIDDRNELYVKENEEIALIVTNSHTITMSRLLPKYRDLMLWKLKADIQEINEAKAEQAKKTAKQEAILKKLND